MKRWGKYAANVPLLRVLRRPALLLVVALVGHADFAFLLRFSRRILVQVMQNVNALVGLSRSRSSQARCRK